MPVTPIKKGYAAIKFFVKKMMMKRGQGITTIPGEAQKLAIAANSESLLKAMQSKGIDTTKVLVSDVEKFVNIQNAVNKQLKTQRTKKFIQQPQGSTSPFQGFTPRVQQDVDSIIKNLKSMEPMDAMKEANLIIGRKGNYKHLSGDEAQKILKETDDHIFQRQVEDLSPDDEFASGGIARVGFAEGKSYEAWLNYRIKEIIKGNLPVPFEEWQKGGLEFAFGGIAGPLHLYNGGRARFDEGGMKRRTFLKLLGGLGALPFVGKFFKAAKPISKAAAPAADVITRGADGIPNYVYDLINVVKAKGTKEIMEGVYKRFPVQKKYTYKGVEVTEDGAGSIKIKSDRGGVATDAKTGKMHEGIAEEHHMQIDSGETILKDEGLETQKAIQAPDEYFEGTVRPDRDGKMKAFEEGLDEAIHKDFKKVADEAKDLIKIKKASGGIVGQLHLHNGGRARFANGSPLVDERMKKSYAENIADNVAQRAKNIAQRFGSGFEDVQDKSLKWLADKSGYTQHNINNQLLRNAMADKRITEEQYKRMGGYDVAQQMPEFKMGNIKIGGSTGDVGLASLLYNAIKSGLNIADPNNPYAKYGGIAAPESVYLNMVGADGLPVDDLALYNQIISGQTSAPATQSTSSAPSGNPIPEYYRNNPGAYDYDRWQQAYANALDARYGIGQGGGTTTIGPGGQIQTSFGSWDPSRTYGAYQSNTQTSSDRPFFESYSDPTQRAQFENIMTSQYGAPGHMKPYYSKGGLAKILGV